MIFKQIDLNNWAAYKGNHSIKFAAGKKNVTLIKGRNQRGKTTLLLAFKWALYGKTDSPKYPNYLSILNRDAKNEGDLKTSVCLTMEIGGEVIEISRSIIGRKSAKQPLDTDFKEELIITRNGRAISENPEAYINSFMANEISEFFLFNGEDLEKYVQLGKEVTKNTELKNAIERVIQTPYLKSAKSVISNMQLQNFNLIADNSQGEKADIDNRIKTLLGYKQSYETDLERLNGDLEDAKKTYLDASSNWENFSQNYQSAVDLQKAEDAINGLEDKVLESKELIKTDFKNAYRILAKEIITKNETPNSKNEISTILPDFSKVMLLEKSIKDGVCAFCNHNLSTDDVKNYKNELKSLTSQKQSPNISNDIAIENQIIGTTQDFSNLVGSIEKFDIAQSDLSANHIAIDNLKDDIGSNSPKDYKKAYDAHEIAKGNKEDIEKAIAAIEAELNGPAELNREDYGPPGIIATLEVLEAQSESLGEDGEESKEEKLDKIYKKVINILQNSISDLSNDVKDVIHDQGNKLYKQMLKDPTKNTLQINSDYGLDLVDKNGEIITDSSGESK